VDVSATIEYLLSKEEIKSLSSDEIDSIIQQQFTFDAFRWQNENHIRISECFRADGIERVLYKCPDCKTEGQMLGKGIEIICKKCGAKHELGEYGELIPINAEKTFTYPTDWYAWEREEVKKDIENGKYFLDTPVNIWMGLDTKKLYDVGEGRLVHNENGFKLTSTDGHISYEHKPLASYSICADFNFYEVGDIIALANPECIYYCFPKNQNIPVAKARLAAEEIYKIAYSKKIEKQQQ
jgi:hypothetical protein